MPTRSSILGITVRHSSPITSFGIRSFCYNNPDSRHDPKWSAVQATLSHYRILEQIGAGGMGVVYRAHDEGTLDRDVAIKVLPSGALAGEEARLRFRREAVALSKLNHPNIATVFDFGSEDGSDFLVEELIPGLSLEEMLAPGSLSEKEVISLASQLCAGIAAAHDQGIVHRDLKPANVRVTPDARIKILDFGLARLLHATAVATGVTASLTQTEQVSGTLPYMAPEQLLNEKLDARTDLWALGCVLYEMATGRRPFLGCGPALIDSILHQQPAPPRKLNHKLSPGLEAIILKCLEKDPALRYASARDVAVDLHRTGTITRPPAARRRTAAIKGFSVAVLLVVVAVAIAWFIQQRQRALVGAIRSIAVLPLANLSGDANQEYFADGMTESLITDLGRLTGLKSVIARGSVMRYKGTNQPLAEIARELKVDALVTGAVLRAGNRVRVTAQLINPEGGEQLWAEHYEREVSDVLRLQNELTSAIAGEIRVKLTANERARLASSRPVNPEAYDACLMGRFEAYKMTPQALDRALDYFQLALDKDPNYAMAYTGIGFVWGLRSHFALVPSNEGWEKTRAAAAKALELDAALPEGHDSLGSVLAWHDWNWGAGEKEYRRAIELDPNYAKVRCFYAFFLYVMRRPQEARDQIDRALDLDPYNALFHAALAMQLLRQGQTDEGIAHLQKAATLQPDNGLVHRNLWRAFAQNREYGKALEEVKESFRLVGAQDVVLALERGAARDGFRGAMRLGADSLALKSIRNPLEVAAMYAAAGDKGRALDWLEKAYQEHSSMLPYINAQPLWDPFRSDPRFQVLLRGMNIPQ